MTCQSRRTPVRSAPSRNAVASATACLLLAWSVSGCNPKPKTGGQVAAQVNGSEITVHDVNRRLVTVEVKNQDLVPQVKREILDELIDRELLVQRAVDEKLDRDPEVMRAIEQARETLLAEAVIERRLAARPEPTDAQVQSFVDAHPELFGKRRVYSLEEFTVAAEAVDPALLSRLDGARSPHDIERVLKEANLAYESETVTRGAEQLPMALAGKLLSLARGDVVTFKDEEGLHLIFIQDFHEAPVDDQLARVNTKAYLANVDKQDVMAGTLKQLRDKATIKYVGEFEQAALTSDRSSVKPEAPVQLPGPASPGGEARDQKKRLPAHVERGLSGLVK